MSRQHLIRLTKKNFKVEYFSGSGAGGQNRNKKARCCRISHPESGAMAIATEQKSQEQNKRMAFKRLTENQKFEDWLHLESMKKAGMVALVENETERQMSDKNLKVEYFAGDKWEDGL